MKSALATALITASLLPAALAHAEPAEVMLVDRLDGDLDFYCLDISGSKENADITRGLQTHTCYGYQGAAGIDQIFETDRAADNQLYMSEFDVCITLPEISEGAGVALAACDGSDAQNISLSANGQLSPVSDPSMCFTAGEETRRGRGGTSEHQIKSLTLQTCSSDLASYQTWAFRAAN